MPTPNRPKSPNEIIAEAYSENERRKKLLEQGQKALEVLNAQPEEEEKEG